MTDYTVRPISDRTGFTRASWQHKRSTFRAAWSVTERSLISEVGHLRGRFLVIECDVSEVDIRLDGRLRASARPTSPAVRVTFEALAHDLGPLAYGTDVFSTWQDNVRAIALGLRALRQVDRYGITQGAEQYRGWKAIEAVPGTDMTRSAAALLLERIAIGDDESAQHTARLLVAGRHPDVKRIVREARAITHPDRNGGDRRQWDHVETAVRVLGLDANGGR